MAGLFLSNRKRTTLADEGRQIRARIEELGFPRVWGKIPPDLLAEVKRWTAECNSSGMSQAAIFGRLDGDIDHITGAEAMLVIDELILALDPPGAIGG